MSTPPNQPPRFVMCRCQNCDGHIEFDGSDFKKGETRSAECPFCKLETIIFVPHLQPQQLAQLPPVLSPVTPPPVPPPTWFGSESSVIMLRFPSGQLIEVTEILLYEERRLQQLADLKAQATKLFGGAQSPYGFWGSASWVIGMTAITSFVLGAQSEKMAEEGRKALAEIGKIEQLLRQTKNWFPVGRIANMACPSPGIWRADVPGQSSGFIHSGDDFLNTKDAAGCVLSIRWSAVEQYEYQERCHG